MHEVAEEVRGKAGFEPDEELQGVLDQYAIDLDAALRRRVELSTASARHYARDRAARMHTDGEQIWEADADNEADRQRYDRQKKEEARVHQRVRDVNRQYRDLIASFLPDDLRGPFLTRADDEALRKLVAEYAFPLDDQERVAIFLSRVRALDDLTDEQHDAIDAVEDAYRPRARSRNDAIFAAQSSVRNVDLALDPLSEWGPRFEKLNEAIAARRELDDQFIAQVRTMLTPAQRTPVEPPAEDAVNADEAKDNLAD